MAGIVRAVISSPSFSISSNAQSGSRSVSSVSSSPFQQLIRLPRKCSPRIHFKLCGSSSYSSHSGLSLRFSQTQANSQPSTSPSLLSRLASLRKSATGEEAVVMSESHHILLRNLGAFSAGSLFLVSAGVAVAETIDVTEPTSSNGEPPTDYLLSFLFIASFVGLLIVTVGAIYLGVTEFLENRQRTAMQKAAGEEIISKGEKRGVVKAGSGKGFGVKKTDKKTEKNE